MAKSALAQQQLAICTVRYGHTTKILAKCVLKDFRMSWCLRAGNPERLWTPTTVHASHALSDTQCLNGIQRESLKECPPSHAGSLVVVVVSRLKPMQAVLMVFRGWLQA